MEVLEVVAEVLCPVIEYTTYQLLHRAVNPIRHRYMCYGKILTDVCCEANLGQVGLDSIKRYA